MKPSKALRYLDMIVVSKLSTGSVTIVCGTKSTTLHNNNPVVLSTNQEETLELLRNTNNIASLLDNGDVGLVL